MALIALDDWQAGSGSSSFGTHVSGVRCSDQSDGAIVAPSAIEEQLIPAGTVVPFVEQMPARLVADHARSSERRDRWSSSPMAIAAPTSATAMSSANPTRRLASRGMERK